MLTIDAGYEERYWYPDDGGEVWVAGYQLIDPASGRYLARDAPELAARGLRVVGVAGAGRHHADAIASDAVAPGRPLELRRDPDNPHDPNAIAVHAVPGSERGVADGGEQAVHAVPGSERGVADGGEQAAPGGEQVGWVPREVAAELAGELDHGRPWSALVLREQRRSPRDPRHGLTMLLAPVAELELRTRP